MKDRSSEKEQRRMTNLGAHLAFVDASQLQSYTEAMLDADVAIACMASPNLCVSAANDFWAIDRDANIRFAQAALQAGARHLILVATFEGRASRHYTAFSDAKEAAVDAIGAACRHKGAAFTVIRPTAYFSDLTDRAFDSVQKIGLHTVVGDGSHRINPIDGKDVARFIAECISDPTKANREHLIGGPDIFSFREIGLLAAEVIGQRDILKIKSIHVWLLQLSSVLSSVAGLAFREPRRSASMLHWMIWSGTHDAIAPVCGSRRLKDVYRDKRDSGLIREPDRGGGLEGNLPPKPLPPPDTPSPRPPPAA